MTVIKSFTDIDQSKKLAEILPLESADMIYTPIMDIDSMSKSGFLDTPECYPFNDYIKYSIIKPLPCWSLAALLSVLCRAELEKDYSTFDDSINLFYRVKVYKPDVYVTNWQDNPVDACYEMILKLHELNLL